VLLVGLIDDFGVLTPAAKLAGQGVAIFVLIRSGAVIELTEVPHNLRWLLAAVWMLGVCNAFNLLDIMDGLAAGTGAIIALALGVVATTTGELTLAAAAWAMAGALLGFVVFNFHPARIYLGDAGSLSIGITLAAITLCVRWSDRSPSGFLAPLAIFAVPLADTAYVSVLRARAGKPFWHGSPDHFPLRLRKRLGGATRRAVTVVYGVCLLGAAIGVAVTTLGTWQLSLWALGAFALAMFALLAWLARVPMETRR
jgi:UDP-GlcNAc:undecaprenyl-phosphate GlcNAc-1-phosphate transferase